MTELDQPDLKVDWTCPECPECAPTQTLEISRDCFDQPTGSGAGHPDGYTIQQDFQDCCEGCDTYYTFTVDYCCYPGGVDYLDIIKTKKNQQ